MTTLFKLFGTENLTFTSKLTEDDLLENINNYCADNSFFNVFGGNLRGRIKANGKFKFIRPNGRMRTFVSRPAILTGETIATAQGCLVKLSVKPGLSYLFVLLGSFIVGALITISLINDNWVYITLGLILMIGVPLFNIFLNYSAKDELVDDFIEQFDLYEINE